MLFRDIAALFSFCLDLLIILVFHPPLLWAFSSSFQHGFAVKETHYMFILRDRLLVEINTSGKGRGVGLDFQAFHSGRNLCKVPGQFWHSRARIFTTSNVQKKYPQKQRVRETSGTTEMAILQKQALKIEAEAWTCQSASTALISMLLIAIIFPRTICICHKYLIYSPSFICT